MILTRHKTPSGAPRWALDGRYLPPNLTLSVLLGLPREQAVRLASESVTSEPATGELLPPIESDQEVWACGVTYLRSRDARTRESTVKDVYERVYEAERPEVFFKALGWRAVGHTMPIRIRRDSSWHAPEPECTLVVNSHAEIVGYTVGNDVSSRDIEGENPLYLPQAKMFVGSCSVGPGIRLATAQETADLPIKGTIERSGQAVWQAETRSSQMKRNMPELVSYLYRELTFPNGVLVMTGTGIVPPDSLTLQVGDVVRITVGELTLENPVT
jgi:2-dehydro-3-deoxy-D-arabinonate dehydratase